MNKSFIRILYKNHTKRTYQSNVNIVFLLNNIKTLEAQYNIKKWIIN